MPDLALLLELGERADRVLDRHLRVDRVELVEVDPLELQALERGLAAAAEAVRAAVSLPHARPRSLEAALGGDHEVLRIRPERLGDQVLGHVGAVRVGGVNQRHAVLDHAAE